MADPPPMDDSGPPDFSQYLEGGAFADAEVRIVLGGAAAGAGAAGARKRARGGGGGAAAATLPGHRMLLHWASPLIVEEEADVEAARLLCRAVYAGAAALQGAGQAALLAVLRLADRFEVSQCASAAARALAAVPREQLDWETAKGVYCLPEACQRAPACGGVLAAAGDKLQAELGDLDAAMRDEGKRARLLALPLGALCALLRDGRTRASCEDAALAVASRWYKRRWAAAADAGEDAQGEAAAAAAGREAEGAAAEEEGGGEGAAAAAVAAAAEPPGDEARRRDARALAGALRLGRLSPIVALTVALRTPWLVEAVMLPHMHSIAAFTAGGKHYARAVLRDGARAGCFESNPEWFLPARPPSGAICTVQGEITSDELEALVKEAPAVSGEDRAACAPLRGAELIYFRGFACRWQVHVKAPPGGSLSFGLFLHFEDEGLFDIACGQVLACHATAEAVHKAGALCTKLTRTTVLTPLLGQEYGWPNFWDVGRQMGFDPARWEARGLLLEGGRVRVELTLSAPP
ncbi:MAG: hypothetical protein J3K34DRAFT_516287 [Monoraphidium minutum]|nr:MAG: hypothetical protein J3K34DRAFT_516287 [Monoraphidium minutum]